MSVHRYGAAFGRHRLLTRALLASTILAGSQTAFGQAPPPTDQLETVVVTAEKRTENLQNVPVAVQALGETKLDQLNINNFADYAKYLPSVSYQTVQPGQTQIFMRGIASGDNGNHSGPLPSVGVYLDEMPVTTILGQLDVHAYDIARIEQLSGPQGTLFGASSEAGTIRIITNQPDKSGFSAAYDLDLNEVAHGGVGNVAEGYVNVPVADNAAIRLVGWEEYDAGFIDNVYGTRTYPTSGGTIDNRNVAESNYNDVRTLGGRMALKVDLDDDWTITPMVMGQDMSANGVPFYDPKVGDLKITHFYPETDHDRWVQLALTIEGKIGNFDLVYAGGYFIRDIDVQQDYSDYSYFYDVKYGYGAYWTNNAGVPLKNPSQYIIGHDHFTKQSHELRLSSPKEDRFRFIGGLFYERQEHDIFQDYKIDGLAQSLSVEGWPDTLWLTSQVRVDRDYAAFGEMSYDITPKLTATGGVRVFDADNTLEGFYGFGTGYSSSEGVGTCFTTTPFRGAPCEDLNKGVDEVNATYKGNLTYHIDPNHMVYFTASSGFRPGGVNRRGDLAPYTSDFLYNYEVGWKTTWFDNTLRWNGDVFFDNWDNFQFSFLGQNGLTVIANAGQAESKGLESDLDWRVTPRLTLSGAIALTDAHLTQDYCGVLGVTSCANAPAPEGTQLPLTPYVKANVTGRYDFPIGGDADAFFQAAIVYNGGSWSDLRLSDRYTLGRQESYVNVDLSGGVGFGNSTFQIYLKNALDTRGQVYRQAECAVSVCGGQTYVVPSHPLTLGIKFGQKF